MQPVTVLLVDDHPVVRQGVAAVLKASPGIAVIGEAANGAEAIRLADQLRPAVIVMDLAMPIINGAEAASRILNQLPATRILVLTSYGQERYVRQALQAGAAGYLLKQTAGEELAEAIRVVLEGGQYLSRRIANILKPCAQAAPSGSQLSVREGQVLQLFAEGYTDRQIAKELSVSLATVRRDRLKVMNRLGIFDRSTLKAAGLALEA